MAGFFTDQANNCFLDWMVGGAEFKLPRRLYVGLSRLPADKNGSVEEPTAGDYARVSIPNDLIHFPPASGGVKMNALIITFPKPTGDWGLIRTVFLSAHPQVVSTIAMADLMTPKHIKEGSEAPTIAPEGLFFSHT